MNEKERFVESKEFKGWKKAEKLVEEGNVKLYQPSDAIAEFVVIGEGDSHKVAIDMDTRQPKCMCEDKQHRNRVCKHELAVHRILFAVAEHGKKLESVLENPKLFVRNNNL